MQHQLLPYLGVYIIDETMLPDGDANAGHIRFSHTLRIGFSVMIANNDQVAAEQQIDAACWRIMNRLWPDQHIMNLLHEQQLPTTRIIESITRGSRRHVFGSRRAEQRNAARRAAVRRFGVLPHRLAADHHR